MLTFFVWFLGAAMAAECQSPRDISTESIQVAWVSRSRKRVAGRSYLEVVRTGELRTWLDKNSRDPLRLFRGLGMVKGNRGQRMANKDWKITFFDVRKDILCRAIAEANPGEDRGGVAICEESQQKPKWGHRAGFTGCGYIQDTQSSIRSLDVYRVRWADAASWGFTVMPLGRFLQES